MIQGTIANSRVRPNTSTTSVVIPIYSSAEVSFKFKTTTNSNYVIDWGNGDVETVTNSSANVNRVKNYSSAFTGDITITPTVMTDIDDITLNKGEMDITNFKHFTGLKIFYSYFANLRGSFDATFGTLMNLENIVIRADSITGTINGLDNVSNLKLVSVISTSITGNSEMFLSNCINLESINLSMNNLTGDVGTYIPLLSNLYYFNFNGNQIEWTYQGLPARNIERLYLRIKSGELSSSEIDQMLIDIDTNATSGSGLIDLRSSGAGAPTSASLAARDSLIAKGRTVNTN